MSRLRRSQKLDLDTYGKTHHNNSSNAFTYLEPSAKDALPGKTQAIQVDQRVRVRVHSKGRRLADIDGYVIKPILDAFTKAGIWTDDSGRYVKEVSFSQEVAGDEETVIDILWDD